MHIVLAWTTAGEGRNRDCGISYPEEVKAVERRIHMAVEGLDSDERERAFSLCA